MKPKQVDLPVLHRAATDLDLPPFLVAVDPCNNSGVAVVRLGEGLVGACALRNIETKTTQGKASPSVRLEAIRAFTGGARYLFLIEQSNLSSFLSRKAQDGFIRSRERWKDIIRSDPACVAMADYHVSTWRKQAGMWDLKRNLGCDWKKAALHWVATWAPSAPAMSHDAAEAAVMALQGARGLETGYMRVEVDARGATTIRFEGVRSRQRKGRG